MREANVFNVRKKNITSSEIIIARNFSLAYVKAADLLICFRANIIVATPGRLVDLFQRQHEFLDMRSCVKSLVSERLSDLSWN